MYDINIFGIEPKISTQMIEQINTFILSNDVKETVVIDINGNIHPYKLICINRNNLRGIFDLPFDITNIVEYNVNLSFTQSQNNDIISVESINLTVKRFHHNDKIVKVNLS